jgi:hypothetical protein
MSPVDTVESALVMVFHGEFAEPAAASLPVGER